MISGLNGVYEVKEMRSLFKVRAISLVLTIAISILIIIALVVILAGGYLASTIGGYYGLHNEALLALENCPVAGGRRFHRLIFFAHLLFRPRLERAALVLDHTRLGIRSVSLDRCFLWLSSLLAFF